MRQLNISQILDTIFYYNNNMNIYKNLTKLIILSSCIFVLNMTAYAAKYTVASGIDFNTRVKLQISSNYNSASADKSLISFEKSDILPKDVSKVFDISEDGDGSILAYIKDNKLYYFADEEVYLNSDISYMFDRFINIKSINLSDFNFSKVKKANFTFSNCKYLTKLDMDNDTIINLDEMIGMFYDCQSINDINLYMLNTSNVKSLNSVFYNCRNLKNIQVSKDIFNTNKVGDYTNLYKDCYLLKTNFGKKATDISEDLYKTYTRTGDDEIEGLLKDVDYDYDDYGKNMKPEKVDSIDSKVTISSLNFNNKSVISDALVNNSKSLSKAIISTNSEFYDQSADMSIVKGKIKLSNALLEQTLDQIPILENETTEVNEIILKTKAAQNIPDDIEVVQEETTLNNTKGILRPSLDDLNKKVEEIKSDSEENIESINAKDNKSSKFSPLNIILIIFGAIAIIIIGIIFAYYKNKKDDNDSLP